MEMAITLISAVISQDIFRKPHAFFVSLHLSLHFSLSPIQTIGTATLALHVRQLQMLQTKSHLLVLEQSYYCNN